MSTIEKAIEIAARAHAGQLDKAGAPYIFHPLRLMFAVQGEHERMAAVLHDVVEDSPLTFDDLAREGFPAVVIDALRALTKHAGESRVAAAHRAAAHPLARTVKLADVTDNMDLRRIAHPDARDFARLEHYAEVKAILQAAAQAAAGH